MVKMIIDNFPVAYEKSLGIGDTKDTIALGIY